MSTQEDANSAISSICGKKIKGYTLSAKHSRSRGKKLFSVQIAFVDKDISKTQLIALLPKDVVPMRVDESKITYVSKDGGKDRLRECLERHTKCAINSVRVRQPQTGTKIHAIVAFADMPDLQQLAKDMNGNKMEEFGGQKIFAEELSDLTLTVGKAAYTSKSREAKTLAATIWAEDKV